MNWDSIAGHVTSGVNKLVQLPAKAVKRLAEEPQAVVRGTEDIVTISPKAARRLTQPKRFTKMKSTSKPSVLVSLKPKPLPAAPHNYDAIAWKKLQEARQEYCQRGLDPSLVQVRRDSQGRLRITHAPPPKSLPMRFREATKELQPTLSYLRGYQKAATDMVAGPFQATYQAAHAAKELATNPDAQLQFAETARRFSQDSEQMMLDVAQDHFDQLKKDVQKRSTATRKRRRRLCCPQPARERE